MSEDEKCIRDLQMLYVDVLIERIPDDIRRLMEQLDEIE